MSAPPAAEARFPRHQHRAEAARQTIPKRQCLDGAPQRRPAGVRFLTETHSFLLLRVWPSTLLRNGSGGTGPQKDAWGWAGGKIDVASCGRTSHAHVQRRTAPRDDVCQFQTGTSLQPEALDRRFPIGEVGEEEVRLRRGKLGVRSPDSRVDGDSYCPVRLRRRNVQHCIADYVDRS